MKLYHSGEKGKAICDVNGQVSTTFKYRDVPFSDGVGLAKHILVGVCDQCGKTLSIPPQSTPAIKAARNIAEVPIEANSLGRPKGSGRSSGLRCRFLTSVDFR